MGSPISMRPSHKDPRMKKPYTSLCEALSKAAASNREVESLPAEIQKQDDGLLQKYEHHKREADRLWAEHVRLWEKHAK